MNESNSRRKMNTFADDIDRSSTLSELERIGERAQRKGIQRQELEGRLRSEGKLLNSLLDEGRRDSLIRSSPLYNEQVPALRESISGMRKRMNTLDSTANSRAESEANNYIGRQFAGSSLNGQANTMMKEFATQNRGMSMGGMSYDALAGQRESTLAQIRVNERHAQNEIKGMFNGRGQVDPERSAAINVLMNGTQDHIRTLGAINAAEAYQRATGKDPNSRMRNLAEMGNFANSVVGNRQMQADVASGGIEIKRDGGAFGVSNGDVNKEIVNQAHILAKALKDLADGANKTDDELAKLRNTADESSDNLKTLQGARGAIDDRRAAGMTYMSALSGGLNAAGGAAQSVMIDQRLQQVSNVAGFANLANQQYDMYTKARGGDIASQMALSQFGKAGVFGNEMKLATNIVQGAYIAGGTIQAGVGVAQVTEGVKNASTAGFMNNGIATNIAQGTGNVMQGGSTAGVMMMDAARGATAQANKLGGINAHMQAAQALNYVGAKQAQGLRNFYTDLDTAGQDLGSGASGFLSSSMSGGNLQAMMDARMSPEQFAKLAQQGAMGMGSTFSGSQILTSRNMERNGFGSASMNMGRMTTLSSAGGENPASSLQGVLEAAFSKSLDTSKAINMVVEHTAAMAAGTSAATMGIDVTGAAATMLAGGVNPNMANKEAALAQAISASQITNNIATDRSASFTGMLNVASLRRAVPGMTGTEAVIAAGITPQELKALQGHPQKAAQFYFNKGINITEENAEQATSAMLGAQRSSISRAKGLGLNMDPSIPGKVAAGTATHAEQLQYNQAGALTFVGGGAEMQRQQSSFGATNTKAGIDMAAAATTGTPDGNIKTQLDTLRTSGFKQLSEAALTASKNLDALGGSALKVFQALNDKYEKDGMRNEKEFSDAAVKMAGSFNASVGLFDKSVTKFDNTISALAGRAGLTSNGNPVVPQFVTDSLNQTKSSTRGK